MNNPSLRLLRTAIRGATLLACFSCINAYATKLEFTVESLIEEGGLWFSPVFLGFHDGSYDSFDVGSLASPSIEAIAENGDSSGLASDIASVMGSQSAVLVSDFSQTAPPGVLFSPQSSNSFSMELDSYYNRYLSFAAMVVPSNDAFIANDDPMAHALFDASGKFNSDFEILIYGYEIWDSGTELNDGMGAAFTTLGGVSTDISVPINMHEGLDLFVDTELPVGTILTQAFSSGTPIARISARQVPDNVPYVGAISGLAIFGFQLLLRKKQVKPA